MNIKKIISASIVFMFCSILCLVLPIQVNAKKKTFKTIYNGTEYFYQFYDDSDSHIVITKIKKMKSKLIIPFKLDGYIVYGTRGTNTSNQLKTDESCENVKKIVIEDGVKQIGFMSFWGFKEVISVYLPTSLEQIRGYAFEDCEKLEQIRIKNSHIKIGYNAFSGCKKLKTIQWPVGTFYGKIGQSAFLGCNLQTLNLPYMPNMKKQIKRFAFAHNDNLKKITFSPKNQKIEIGKDWFSDCEKSKIIVGKNVKSFSSAVNANTGSVRLLGKKTKLKGFKKIEKLQNMPTEEFEKLDKEGKTRYYIQYKKFIVPKKSKALKVLNRAYYGKINDVGEERYDSDSNEYYNSTLKKVKVVVK